MEEVTSSEHEGSPYLSSDGLSLYLYSTRDGGAGGRDLRIATRADNASPFDAPSWLPAVNSDDNDCLPTLTSDELTLVFASNRSGGMGDADLWISRSAVSDDFGTPINLSSINTAYREAGAAFLADGLILYFNSDRDSGMGASDIHMAARTDRDAAFGQPANVSILNRDAA